jgi:glycosyltransferase involved in cell wall biosynthesis
MAKKRLLHIAGGRGGAFLAADNLVNAVNSYSQEFEADILINRQSGIQRLKSKSLTLFQSITSTDMYEFHSAESIATVQIAEIERYSPDLIHIHNWYNLLDLNLIGNIINQYPTIFTLHDERMLTGGCHMTFGCMNYRNNCSICPAEKFIHGKTMKSKLKLRNILSTDSTIHTIVPSKWLFDKVHEEISSEHRSTLHKVRNLVDPVFTSDLNTFQRDQSNYELRIIFIAANLNSNVKNLKSLFEALIELLSNQTILKVKLTLVGGGKIDLPPITSSLRIILKESLSPNQVLREFEQQDLCIIPSLSENRPNVIVEAMLSGVFVIASKVGGIPEMVEDDVTGYTCDPNRIGILEALRRYLESSESKKRGIINVAHERASKEHQPVKIVQEHERIYRDSYNSWSS